MCEKYCCCEFCGYNHNDCLELGDGSPFCRWFQCTVEDCQRFECISYEELYLIYNGY